MATMMVDSFATGYCKRSQIRKALPVNDDEAATAAEAVEHGHVHVHGHVHGAGAEEGSVAETIRHRVISQVRKEKIINFISLFNLVLIFANLF